MSLPCAGKRDRATAVDARTSLLAGLLVAALGACATTAGRSGPREGARPPDPKLVLELGRGVSIELAYVPPGNFMMGSAYEITYRYPDTEAPGKEMHVRFAEEKPVHEVAIVRGLYIGTHVVSQRQYEAVMGTNPSSFKKPYRAVEVTWDEANAFCRALSRETGLGFRLPTEAEWEYACRAGSQSEYCFGDDVKGLAEYAWYDTPRLDIPTGAKRPNAWGLYDVHGLVWEWCSDIYDEKYYARSPREDPRGPESGELRVIRGGMSTNGAEWCRSAVRMGIPTPEDGHGPGFRVTCDQGFPGTQ